MMGQFILLSIGQMLLIDGGLNGTAGYSTTQTPFDLCRTRLHTCHLRPNTPLGSRWSRQGISPSQIPWLYHSTALLPDASVLVTAIFLACISPSDFLAD